MTRATISIVVLLLAFVIVGGPCLACAAILAGSSSSGCCHTQKDCQQRLPGSVSDCVTPPVDLASLEQVPAPVLVAILVVNEVWNFEPPQFDTHQVSPDPVLHSPPDLCLRNSVLTI